MPEFVDVSSHFDDLQAFEAYTDAPLFLAQFNTFDETSIDGSINKKRSMSVRPGTVMPPRGVLKALSEFWLIGDGNTDGFRGQAVRVSYLLKKATHTATVHTPGQYLVGLPGTSVYVNRDFRKETVNGISTSEYQPFWDIFTAPCEQVRRGTIFSICDTLYRTRATYVDLAGLRQAATDQLEPGAVVSVSYLNGAYDQVTEQWGGSAVIVPGLLLDMYMLYELNNQADPKSNSGDKTLVVAAPISVGKKISIAGVEWTVLTAQPELDAFKHHIRRN